MPSAGVRLESRRVTVQGRRAAYSVGGDGFPVVFLHGWGLGERSYKRALKRLTARGCRVYAPSLPGFGGTSELPRGRREVEHYATWVRAFMDAVGIHTPVLVVGHSLGGGISIKLAHDYPDAVRYLVLLNAVGGAEELRAPGAPAWQWVLRFARDLTPPDEGLRVLRAAAEDFIPNLLNNPLAMWEASLLARRADLREELRELGRRKLPVLVLWGDHDRVLPLGLFSAVCEAIGTEGQTVPGSHSWLLAAPDAFGEVMTNVVEVAARTGSATELEHMLDNTSMPPKVMRRLLGTASALWLMSEGPAVLAGDLALCHPKLRRREVRAVARPLEAPGSYRLTVVAHDRPGLLADTCGVLAAADLSISAASATTWTDDGVALHALTVDAPAEFPHTSWEAIGKALRSVAAGGRPGIEFAPAGRAFVRSTPQATGYSLVSVTAPDQVGLLWAVCDWFASHDVNIESARVGGEDGVAHDEFIVSGRFDPERLAARLTVRAPALWERVGSCALGTLRFVRDLYGIPF